MFRANTVYEGEYLLGTSIARPLIAKRQIEIARAVGAQSVSHGATGKGNIKVISPWREWDLLSREKLLAYAEKGGHSYRNEAQARRRALLHGREPAAYFVRRPSPGRSEAEAEADMWRWTVAPEDAPDQPEYLDIEYEKGDPVALNGKRLSPADMLTELNAIGGKHGIGRLDLVENRYVGMKSRGCL